MRRCSLQLQWLAHPLRSGPARALGAGSVHATVPHRNHRPRTLPSTFSAHLSCLSASLLHTVSRSLSSAPSSAPATSAVQPPPPSSSSSASSSSSSVGSDDEPRETARLEALIRQRIEEQKQRLLSLRPAQRQPPAAVDVGADAATEAPLSSRQRSQQRNKRLRAERRERSAETRQQPEYLQSVQERRQQPRTTSTADDYEAAHSDPFPALEEDRDEQRSGLRQGARSVAADAVEERMGEDEAEEGEEEVEAPEPSRPNAGRRGRAAPQPSLRERHSSHAKGIRQDRQPAGAWSGDGEGDFARRGPPEERRAQRLEPRSVGGPERSVRRGEERVVDGRRSPSDRPSPWAGRSVERSDPRRRRIDQQGRGEVAERSPRRPPPLAEPSQRMDKRGSVGPRERVGEVYAKRGNRGASSSGRSRPSWDRSGRWDARQDRAVSHHRAQRHDASTSSPAQRERTERGERRGTHWGRDERESREEDHTVTADRSRGGARGRKDGERGTRPDPRTAQTQSDESARPAREQRSREIARPSPLQQKDLGQQPKGFDAWIAEVKKNAHRVVEEKKAHEEKRAARRERYTPPDDSS